MSTRNLRNVMKRRIHKERSQPAARAKLGLLEKHKDYKQRAVDYHKKEDRIKVLKEKAAMRNPDEFYFGMNKEKTKDGLHVVNAGDGKTRTLAEYKNMKNQDINYLKTKNNQEAHKIERLQSELHYLDEDTGKKVGRSHVIFVDNEKAVKKFDAAKHFKTTPELVDRAFNRPTITQLEGSSMIVSKTGPKMAAKVEKEREKSYKELNERIFRQDQIKGTLNKLEDQRKMLGKGKRRKISVKDEFGEDIVEKTQFKWKLKRKR